MATIHTCDKCGEIIKNFTAPTSTIKVPSPLAGGGIKEMHLCVNCLMELRVELGLEKVARIDES